MRPSQPRQRYRAEILPDGTILVSDRRSKTVGHYTRDGDYQSGAVDMLGPLAVLALAGL